MRNVACFLCALLLGACTVARAEEAPGAAAEHLQPHEIVTVVFWPFQEANVSAEVSARIVKVTKRFGDHFTKGELLVELDKEMFLQQRNKAAATLKLAEANLNAAEAQYETKGQRRRAAAKLAVAHASLQEVMALQEKEVQLRKARAILDFAEQNLESIERLAKDGEASSLQLAEARRDKVLAEANLEIAQAGQVAELEAARQQVIVAETELKEVENILLPQVEQARKDHAVALANHGIAERELANCSVLAPFDGRVRRVHRQEHELVQRGEPVIHVINDTVLLAKFLLPSRMIRSIAIGQKIPIRVMETGDRVVATVSQISATVDPASETVEVRAEVENADRRLESGSQGEFPLSVIAGGE